MSKYIPQSTLRSGVCPVCGTAWAALRLPGIEASTCGWRCRKRWQRQQARPARVEPLARQCAWCGEQWAGPGYDSPHGLVCRSECLRQAIEDAGQEVARG